MLGATFFLTISSATPLDASQEKEDIEVKETPSASAEIKKEIKKSKEKSVEKVDAETKRDEVLAKERARELGEKRREEDTEKEGSKRRPLKFGPLTVNPNIGYRFTWDDNIYLTDTDRRADYISQFAPGLDGRIELPFGLPIISMDTSGIGTRLGEKERTLVDFEYKPDLKSFFEHPEEGNVAHTFIGICIVPSNLFGGRGKLVFGFRDIFKYTTDPATSEDSKFRPRYNNDMEAKAKYAASQKISMAIAYRHIIEWYTMDTMENFNYNKYLLTPTIYYNITAQSALFLDSDFAKTIYDPGNRGSKFLQISGGVTGQVTPKTNVYFKAGYQIRTYTHDEIYGDYSSFTTRGALQAQLKKDVSMKLTFSKDAVESVYQDNPYFDLKQFDFELVKNLTGKMSIMAGGTFGRNDYPRNSDESEFGIRTRRDYIWGIRGGISYQLLRGLDSSVSYEFRGRDSNFKKYDYRDNRIIANIKFAY